MVAGDRGEEYAGDGDVAIDGSPKQHEASGVEYELHSTDGVPRRAIGNRAALVGADGGRQVEIEPDLCVISGGDTLEVWWPGMRLAPDHSGEHHCGVVAQARCPDDGRRLAPYAFGDV